MSVSSIFCRSLFSICAFFLMLALGVDALTIKDYFEKLDNQAKGAFIAGHIDGMREGLESRKDRHGNLKTVETISEHLALLDFIDELLPSNPKEAQGPGSGILELLGYIEESRIHGKQDQQVEGVIKGFVERKFKQSLEVE